MDDNPDANQIGIQIMILVALTLVNAFFACAEMAMVSVSKSKIRKLADEGKRVRNLFLSFWTSLRDFYQQFKLQ